jgi:hypothetical protein
MFPTLVSTLPLLYWLLVLPVEAASPALALVIGEGEEPVAPQ